MEGGEGPLYFSLRIYTHAVNDHLNWRRRHENTKLVNAERLAILQYVAFNEPLMYQISHDSTSNLEYLIVIAPYPILGKVVSCPGTSNAQIYTGRVQFAPVKQGEGKKNRQVYFFFTLFNRMFTYRLRLCFRKFKIFVQSNDFVRVVTVFLKRPSISIKPLPSKQERHWHLGE